MIWVRGSDRVRSAMLGDIRRVIGHHIHAARNDALDAGQILFDLGFARQIRQRMIGTRAQSLPVHDLQPGHVREQLVALAKNPAMALVQVYLLTQRIGDFHVPAVAPELRIVALRGMVVQDDEIPDAFVLELRLAIELGDIQRD